MGCHELPCGVQVTGSDDKTWKMWHLPRGDLIMSGEGHTDWLAGVAFHPKVCPAPPFYYVPFHPIQGSRHLQAHAAIPACTVLVCIGIPFTCFHCSQA